MRVSTSGILTRARFEARHLLSSHPGLFLPLMRRRPSHQGKVIDDRTDIVIEGFPRSGNTFAAAAFEMSQPRPVRIARHLHAPAHVIEGIRRGLPVIVVVRRPDEAVVSEVIRHPELSLSQALRHYTAFHRRLLSHRHQFVIARFEQVTSDFGVVIEEVNARFGTDFATFDHTPQTVERVFARVDEMDRQDTGQRAADPAATTARPTSSREVVKAQLRDRLESPRLRSSLRRAMEAHTRFLTAIP